MQHAAWCDPSARDGSEDDGHADGTDHCWSAVVEIGGVKVWITGTPQAPRLVVTGGELDTDDAARLEAEIGRCLLLMRAG